MNCGVLQDNACCFVTELYRVEWRSVQSLHIAVRDCLYCAWMPEASYVPNACRCLQAASTYCAELYTAAGMS